LAPRVEGLEAILVKLPSSLSLGRWVINHWSIDHQCITRCRIWTIYHTHRNYGYSKVESVVAITWFLSHGAKMRFFFPCNFFSLRHHQAVSIRLVSHWQVAMNRVEYLFKLFRVINRSSSRNFFYVCRSTRRVIAFMQLNMSFERNCTSMPVCQWEPKTHDQWWLSPKVVSNWLFFFKVSCGAQARW
jgi:hypothetical protein